MPRLVPAFPYHRTGMYTALELLDNKTDKKWTGQRSTPQHFRKIVLVGAGLLPFRTRTRGYGQSIPLTLGSLPHSEDRREANYLVPYNAPVENQSGLLGPIEQPNLCHQRHL